MTTRGTFLLALSWCLDYSARTETLDRHLTFLMSRRTTCELWPLDIRCLFNSCEWCSKSESLVDIWRNLSAWLYAMLVLRCRGWQAAEGTYWDLTEFNIEISGSAVVFLINSNIRKMGLSGWVIGWWFCGRNPMWSLKAMRISSSLVQMKEISPI